MRIVRVIDVINEILDQSMLTKNAILNSFQKVQMYVKAFPHETMSIVADKGLREASPPIVELI